MNALPGPRSLSAPALSGARVEVRNVTRIHGRGPSAVTALLDCDLDVAAGSLTVLLGPSGCGKSTLLNLIAGFDTPTSGRILEDGEPLAQSKARRGVVFQDTAALFPWLSVAGNVAFGLRGKGLRRGDIAARVAAVLELVGLAGFGHALPQNLSGGMRQLAAIARVLVLKPALLLMDEPFAALDALTRQRMQARLVEIWQRTGVTVVFITHSVDEAVFLGDETIVMSGRPGRVLRRIPLPLARPRISTSAEFNLLKAEALDLLGVLPPERSS